MKCVRFGVFEVDPQARELRKGGVRIKLENQPFEILEALLENPGRIVTRGELQRRLWDEGTFVDFEKSVTKAVNKLRLALGDSAATPRFIETLSRRGYRFVAPVAVLGDQPPVAAAEEPARPDSGDGLAAAGTPESAKPGRWRWLRRWPLLAIAGLLAAVVTLSVGTRSARLRGLVGMPRIESLAVLPIENLTGDARQEYLADELTDELINHLAMIGSLRVISRTSAMRYKAAKKALPEIARELRVDGVVEGSMQRPMDRLRINIRLMHAPADRQLWAQTYEGNASEAAALLRQMTVAIAHEISARLTAEDSSRLFGQRPRNPVAYDAYLRGRYLWNLRGPEPITEAASYFKQALQEDPQFALAYSGLSDCNTIGWDMDTDCALGEQYARKAIALEPDLAEGHVSLAMAQMCQFQFADAERELKRGIQLNPNYVTAHLFYARYLLTMGRAAEALAENDRALQLDPFSLAVNNLRTNVLVGLRQYDRALEQIRIVQEIAPEERFPHQQLARIYWLQGRVAEAVAEERRLAPLVHSERWERGQAEVEAAYETGRFRSACLKSAQLQEWLYQHYRPFDDDPIPLLYGDVGDDRKVLEWLDRLLREPGNHISLGLKTAPEFDFLRGDPRFQELLRRTGLPQ